MRKPAIYTTEQIKKWDCQARITRQGREYWTPARPYPRTSLSLGWRLKMCWYVFIGKCDVLMWIER